MNPYDALRQLYDYARRGGLHEEALEECYEAIHDALPVTREDREGSEGVRELR